MTYKLYISHWTHEWLVLFNADQTLSMIFSCKLNPVQCVSLIMSSTVSEGITSHKHLGLIFSNSCTCIEHVHNTCDQVLTCIKS